MIRILILAAGSSRRMRGRDKLLEDIDGVPLLRRTALRALATEHPVHIALPARPHPRFDALKGLDVAHVEVANAALGMSESLKAGIAALPQDTTAALVVLADMPELDTGHFNAVISARRQAPDALVWRAADDDGKPGHPVLFDAQLFGQFAHLTGDTGAQQVVAAAKPHVHLVVGLGDAPHIDLDTPEAWQAWRAKTE